jgi:hypothetical protein
MKFKSIELQGALSNDRKCVLIYYPDVYDYLLKPLAGITLHITIKSEENKRTLKQLRYAWGVCIPCIQYFLFETKGEKHTKDAIYTWIKIHILKETPVVCTIMGKEFIQLEGKTFSEMNKEEFSDAIDTIIKEMAIRGCYIPPPTGSNYLHDF